MTEREQKPPGEVLTSLPSRRPQRRSRRRDASSQGSANAATGARVAPKPRPPAKPSATAKPAAAKGTSARGTTAKGTSAKGASTRAAGTGTGRRPTGVRPSEATRRASSIPSERPANSPEGIELVGTAIQAAGELAQFGLTLGTKALRGAVSRIPRP
jgi:hypothetical protein